MLYFSDRALTEVEGSRIASSSTSSSRGFSRLSLAYSRHRTVDVIPGPRQQVDHALKLARRSRHVARDLWSLNSPGQLFDTTVSGLRVGIMPIWTFAGETDPNAEPAVRAFWASVDAPPRAPGGSPLHVVLVGSLDNVGNRGSAPTPDERIVMHNFPSEPWTLGPLLALEMTADQAALASEQFKAEVAWSGQPAPGDEALFAYNCTVDASGPVSLDDNQATTWERRPALARARTVGIVRDSLHSPDGLNVLLARPVLIEERT